jgi:Na+/phosphate symporter
MKVKNLPDDINSKSLDELTQEANNIIEQLEKKDDLKTSLDQYQELMRLNNIIEKKFQKKSKYINQSTREKINSFSRKKDEE